MDLKNTKNIFFQIDAFLFNKISIIQNSNAYGQYKAFIKNNFDEPLQKIINQSLTILIVMSPLVIVLMFFFFNLNIRSQLTTVQTLNEQINKITQQQSSLNRLKNKIGLSRSLTTDIILQKKILQIFHKYNLNNGQVKKIEFHTSSTEVIKKVKANVFMTNLSTEGTFNLLQELNDRYKMNIEGLTIKKKTGGDTLNVTMILSYLIAK